MFLVNWRRKRTLILCVVVATLLASGAAARLAAAQAVPVEIPGLEYFATGDVRARTPGPTSPGLLLVGGGRQIPAAFAWFAAQAGHGHIVILRASGDAELQGWIAREVGGVASVQTLVFHARAPADDPRVLDIVRRADGIFIAGGDQANYVRYWKGTPLAALLDAHVRAGKPLGGTSAGLAILGAWGYGALDGGSITSKEALADPAGKALTLVDDFLALDLLKDTITDTHFAERKRLGRLLAFVARTARDAHRSNVTGLGVDQDSALLVEADGRARLLSWHPGGHAWIVEPTLLRERELAGGRAALDAYLCGRVTTGKPLDVAGFRVIGVGTQSRLQLPGYRVEDPAFELRIDVHAGVPVERAVSGTSPSGVIE